LTIIFGKGQEFWIESFEETDADVATAGFLTMDATLERPGTFLGASANLGFNDVSNDWAAPKITNQGGGVLSLGQKITGITMTILNNGAESDCTAHLLVFMSKG